MDGQSLQAPGWILLDAFSPPISMASPLLSWHPGLSHGKIQLSNSTEATGLLPSSSDIFKAQNTLMQIYHPFVPWIHLRGRTFPDFGSLLVYVVPVYATSETTNTGVSHPLTFYYGSMHSDHHPKTGHFQHQMSLLCITIVPSYVWYPLHKLQ